MKKSKKFLVLSIASIMMFGGVLTVNAARVRVGTVNCHKTLCDGHTCGLYQEIDASGQYNYFCEHGHYLNTK